MGLVDNTTLNYWGKSFLNYNWYWVFAVFFGWAAIDQLYLASPYTFILKIVVNIFTLGYWWYYDAIMATFNQPQVKLFGPSIPAYGPAGIGGGRFFDDPNVSAIDKKKHANYLIFGIVLVTLGLIGGDSFLVGDNLSGWIRIIMLFSFVFTPVALIWFVYKLYLYFIQPQQLLDQNWAYFGAQKPADYASECPNVLETFTAWVVDTAGVVLEYIPVLNQFAPFLRGLAASLRVAYGIASTTVKTAINTAATAVEAKDAVEQAIEVTSGKDVTASALEQARNDIMSRGQTALAEQTVRTVGGGVAALSAISPSISPVTGLALVAVVGFIVVSGVVISLRRSIQKSIENGKQRGDKSNDDVPPEPREIGGDAE